MSRRLYVKKDDKIQVLSSPRQKSSLDISWEYVGGKEGKVIWVMDNPTSDDMFVSLYRGATLEEDGQTVTIPSYLFGNAFAEVYLANGLSGFVQNLRNIPSYTLAVVQSNNTRQIAFVFRLPAYTMLKVPEYGFVNLKGISATLYPVKPIDYSMFSVLWDFDEVPEYIAESGVSVQSPSDPYAVQSYEFAVDHIGNVMTPRVVLPIPKSWVALGTDVASFLEKIESLFKHV